MRDSSVPLGDHERARYGRQMILPGWGEVGQEKVKNATVDPAECIGCKTCVDSCQFGAAQVKYYPEIGEERAYIDTEKCLGCGCCVIDCPAGARAMKLVRPPEHIPDTHGAY